MPLVLICHIVLIIWNSPKLPFVLYAVGHMVDDRSDRHRASRHDKNSGKQNKTEGHAKVMCLDNPRGLEWSHHKQENCEHQHQRRQQRIANSEVPIASGRRDLLSRSIKMVI